MKELIKKHEKLFYQILKFGVVGGGAFLFMF